MSQDWTLAIEEALDKLPPVHTYTGGLTAQATGDQGAGIPRAFRFASGSLPSAVCGHLAV
jgi:hypothetical protein